MIYGLVVIIPASTANYARVFENLRARGHRAPEISKCFQWKEISLTQPFTRIQRD